MKLKKVPLFDLYYYNLRKNNAKPSEVGPLGLGFRGLVEKYFFPLPNFFMGNETPWGGRLEPAFRSSGASNQRPPRSPQNTGELINELRKLCQKSCF